METVPLGVRKGAWTEEEDMLLKKCIEKYGEGKWYQIPLRAGKREREREVFDYSLKVCIFLKSMQVLAVLFFLFGRIEQMQKKL